MRDNYVYSIIDRYQSMRYFRCDDSGFRLPAVSLGSWHNFGDTAPYEKMKQLCLTAFDRGITHFDLANNYGPTPGSAEKNLGLILKEHLTLTGMSWLSAPKWLQYVGWPFSSKKAKLQTTFRSYFQFQVDCLPGRQHKSYGCQKDR